MNSRILINPSICHGKPVIKGTRVLVSNVIADLAAGSSYDEIIRNYPTISADDIRAALEFCSNLANFETVDADAHV